MKSTRFGFLMLGWLTVSSTLAGSAVGPRCAASYEPEQVTFGPVGETEPDISPDGRWMAYQYFAESSPQLARIGILNNCGGFDSARPLVDQHGYAAEMSKPSSGRPARC